MAVSELLELVQAGRYDQFEDRCLALLGSGELALAQLVTPLIHLERSGQTDRLITLAQMIFDNLPPSTDPAAALAISHMMLLAAPNDETLRRQTVTLYEQVHGHEPHFAKFLAASGLNASRPVRPALRLLDFCLSLRPGDTLICRADDRVVEITDINHDTALFTLRREARITTIPAPEVARDYERIAADDFRVLRQLRPHELTQRIEDDPVAVVVGLIDAHGGLIDADLLKHELVPRFIETQAWSRWWTRARGLLKRSPHILIEGRSPLILKHCAAGLTLEDETWQTLTGKGEPGEWMSIVEGYIREQASRKETADPAFLQRCHDHLVQNIEKVRSRRPAEALACALAIQRLAEKGLPCTADSRGLAVTMLREADDPGALLKGVALENLRERGMEALAAARPADWVQFALAWLPSAPAGLLDKLATSAIAAGQVEAVQSFIDYGLRDLPRHPELVYWLWKGPTRSRDLRLPTDAELFQMILDTLSALGRTVTAEPDVVKEFRHRIKAALALRDYDRVRRCLEPCSEAAAITIRTQMLRLEGLGDNAPARLLDLLRDVHPKLWVIKPKALAPWQDPVTLWNTAAGARRRTAERDEILNVKMPANAVRIGEAASHGDLSENSEYKFALEERDLLRARLAVINDELSRTRMLDPHDVPADHVGIGSRVTLRSLAAGTERVMSFFGPFDTDVERGIFSYQAPMSQKLMGLRIGGRVTLAIDGLDTDFEIIALASALE